MAVMRGWWRLSLPIALVMGLAVAAFALVAVVIGLAVGWSGVLFAVLIAIFSAAAFGLVYLVVQLLRGRYTLFTAIPYGPFLVLGALTIYLYGQEIAAAYAGR